MSLPERLDDGSLRYPGARCSFVLSRVRPGGLHLAIAGDDRGEGGTGVFEELEREYRRFALPLRVWVDARRASAPADAARDAWTSWFRTHRADLERVDVLVPSAVVELTANVVRTLSTAEREVHVVSDAQAFDRSLDDAAPGTSARVGPSGAERTRVEPSLEATGDGHRLTDGACAYVFRRLSPSVLRVDISGRDAGRMGAQPIDEVIGRLEALARPRALFLDAQAVATVSDRAREEWTAFLRGHRETFDTLSMLAGSPLMQLTLSVARESAQAGRQMRIYKDRPAFENDVRRRAGYSV